MEIGKKINILKDSLEGRLTKYSADVLSGYPIEEYIRIQSNYPPISNYKYISSEVRNFAKSFIKTYNSDVFGHYNKLAILHFIESAISGYGLNNFPEEIKENYIKRFTKILNSIEKAADDSSYYQLDDDKFLKNLAISKLKMIPAGVQNLDIDHLSRGFIFRNGLKQFISGVVFVGIKCRGFKPFYRMHMNQLDREAMSEFNPEGWQKLFHMVSLLLLRNTNIKGLAGNSWIFDPEIKEISPELGYIHELIENYNGHVFVQGTDSNTIRNATFINPNRKKLFKEKKYFPKRYLLIIPRKNLLSQ